MEARLSGCGHGLGGCAARIYALLSPAGSACLKDEIAIKLRGLC